ncbi:hypothetical protein LJB95_02645 [Paludibacteraceae bacterium OttesenSCG-928-F17]|nr:hypothetical protein [Paludibacteraceae bacterium OttesenSCG-928-F17]
MLFTSLVFLCFFLPVVLVGYFLIPAKYKNFFLFITSLIFYIWGEKGYVILLLGTITLNYVCSLIIAKGYKKTGLITAIVVSLLSLFYFKYAGFTYTNIVRLLDLLHWDSSFIKIPQIVLPLGISFYTFQVLSYTIDVYRGEVQPSKNFWNFATYVTFFPQLIAGPIVRYSDVEKQLIKKNITTERIAQGIERFIIGLIKKMFVANNCAVIADTIFNLNPDYYSAGAAWIAIIAYSLQIYFDFSAYSDMAIGIARACGLDFLENFNYPYISKSIKEFWRRWHISLSTWFRDYLYIPLGGNRISRSRTYINLSIVFLATGLWHGASWNFIVWGIWHGLFIVIERAGFEKVLTKLFKPLQYIYTLLVVIVGWVFFRADNLSHAVAFLKKMFFINTDIQNVIYSFDSFITIKNSVILPLAILCCFPVFGYLKDKISTHKALVVLYYAIILLSLVVVISMLSFGTYNPFIYFRF